MANLYNRNFKSGRASEQLLNEELHRHYKILEHYMDSVLNPNMTTNPTGTMDSSMWHERETNELKWFDKTNNIWKNFYENKFALIEHLMDVLPPSNPIRGQLWIHQGVLCYYDGTTWQPIKALVQDGSQFSLDVFKNFLLISPLWKIGNVVVPDETIALYENEERKYIEGQLNARDDSMDAIVVDADGNPTTWTMANGHMTTESAPQMPVIDPEEKCQLLIPQIDYARIFLDNCLDTTKYEEISKVCIQYKRQDLIHVTPSLVHINPGRITKILKRFIKVDKVNPKIQISSANTEFYGFKFDSILGDFLLPDGTDNAGNEEKKDYTIVEDGILLEYSAAHNYDYVLAITYDFSWLKSTGTMNKVTNKDLGNMYYIQDYVGPITSFVDGYNLEDPYFKDDSYNQTVEFEEDIRKREIAFLHVPKREYGYIRMLDINNNGIVKPLKEYKHPLLFINGESQYSNYTINDKGYFCVPDAKIDMAWCIIDLYDAEKDEDLFYMAGNIPLGTNDPAFVSTYTIPKAECNAIGASYGTQETVYAIKYDPSLINNDDNIVLFINGLLVSKESVVVDKTTGYIYVYTGFQNEDIDMDKYNTDPVYATEIDNQIISGKIEGNNLHRNGLVHGCEFLIINDKYNWLYDKSKLTPALGVGSLSDTLVYMNGYLLCSRKECIPYTSDKDSNIDIYGNKLINNQIVRKPSNISTTALIDEVNDPFEYYIYSAKDKNSVIITQRNEIDNIKLITESYSNAPRSISLNIDYSLSDRIDIFAFTTANADVEQPLIIANEEIEIGVVKKDFTTPSTFNPNTNSLMVWVDGVRMYPKTDDVDGIVEHSDGTGFSMPYDIGGDGSNHYVTMVIEKPERDALRPCNRAVITEKNIAPNVVNMYSTRFYYDKNGNKLENNDPLSLYPGRVTIYVNGIRQPENSYTLHDNYTFSFNSMTIIGSDRNYPIQSFADKYGNIVNQTHNQPDYILVEVREDNRQVANIEIDSFPTYEIDPNKYDIDTTILEASDEIMIFVNGLYFGAKKNDGYHINISRGTISISDNNTCDIINSDSLYEYLKGNQQANQTYLLRHDNVPYKHANSILTLEWR